MKNRIAHGAVALCLATLPASALAAEAVVTDRNISVSAFVDAGQVMNGSLVSFDGATSDPVDNMFLNRDGVALTYSGTMNGKLHMNIGVGGLFWKPVPETPDAGSKRINFGPGISEASARYDFTDRATLKFGFFGYKYNPDAVNLGEYLLRSEAYPTIIQTGSVGGWVWMNSNEYKSMGAQFSMVSASGKLRQDVLLFSEFNQAPIFDFSPSYIVTAKPVRALEIGAGISLHRWLPIEASREAPDQPGNTYVEIDNFPEYYLGVEDQVTHVTEYRKAFQGGTLKEIQSRITSFSDSTGALLFTQSVDAQGRTVFIRNDDVTDTLRIRKSERLSFQAIKVMARASLDLAVLLDMPRSSGDFRVFAEAAVLGLENQPLFYEDITQRIPVMVGVNLPTFGILDLLSFQVEYLKNPYPDNNYEQFNNNVPKPAYPLDNPLVYADRRAAGEYSDDDLKWSAFLKKSVVPGLDVFLQVANDHLRVQDFNAQPSFMPVTRSPSDWYYMLRFQWSM